MSSHHQLSRFAGAAFFCAIALLATGCALTVPISDPTPPTVAMTVTGLGPAFTVNAASGPVTRNAPTGATVVMLAAGTDKNGGVKNIRIQGAASVSCASGDLGQATSVHYLASNPEDAGVGPGDEAVDSRLTSLTIDVDGLAAFCGSGFTFNGASAGFSATAENFHGGSASTPSFTLNHP